MWVNGARQLFATHVMLVIACSCSDPDDNRDPPLGFGVPDEAHLVNLLTAEGIAPTQARCVATVAFAANPSTENYSDGSYDITQAMLATGAEECDVDWSDYNFTHD